MYATTLASRQSNTKVLTNVNPAGSANAGSNTKIEGLEADQKFGFGCSFDATEMVIF